jgi:glycosyltransferase involved in cell wall biosynthesis
MNLLYLSPWFPFPPTNGSELRIHALLRGLAARHDVTLLSFQRRPVDPRGLEEARDLLAAVHLVPWREFDPGSHRARLGLLSARPRSVVDTHSPEMESLIRQTTAERRYDAVIASELGMAAYWPAWGDLPAVLDDLELGAFREQARAAASPTTRARRRLMWAKLRAYARDLLPRFAAVTVVSERERALLREVAPRYAAVELIPNGVDLAGYAAAPAALPDDKLIFTGAFTYDANYEAMVWFLGEVYPLIQREAPGVQMIITGDHAGKPLPPAANVTLTGYVDDVRPLVAGAAVSVVPIRQGGGTRLKILEAMALGTPVVATAKGAEGLDGTHERELLLADAPEAFAAAVLRLLRDKTLRQQLVNNACRLVRAQYDWAIILPRFLDVVERAAGERAGAGQSAPRAVLAIPPDPAVRAMRE